MVNFFLLMVKDNTYMSKYCISFFGDMFQNNLRSNYILRYYKINILSRGVTETIFQMETQKSDLSRKKQYLLSLSKN